ncbi:amidase/amidohydrolase, metal ion dependent [Trichoderma guizhouense]|uniref:Peptidase M20 domain-containing protein 2 n=1 Tax=Trichoderma guizhouense TaxID=1491466 RepID=A0A1T3CRZ8_9HYPO|nr:amidase/amidohydrolase, metal ion dependent [Trichoderma guizhouense]
MVRLKSNDPIAEDTVKRLLNNSHDAIDAAGQDLRALNKAIHDNPELGYQEFYAVETISSFLQKHGYTVTKQAYGLETSFMAEIGSGGSLVIICIEYDALPDIGHACGHNLITTSSMAAFLGAAKVLQSEGFPGRVRILGTPAEEGGGGKVKLIEAGAFDDEDIAAAIMAHPLAAHQFAEGYDGLAGLKFIASQKFEVEFRGRSAHAAGEPWNGVNALDAAVMAYNGISMLRQQMRPDERVHGVINDGGTAPNVIANYTRMTWLVRGPSAKRSETLLKKVQQSFNAAALSTGCEYNIIPYVSSGVYVILIKIAHSVDRGPTYEDLRVNDAICQQYADDMLSIGEKILVKDDNSYTASTDMGDIAFFPSKSPLWN